MTSATGTLILYISLIIITVGGIVVFYEITSDIKDNTIQLQHQEDVARSEDLRLVGSVGYSIEDEKYKYVRVQVAYDGEEALDLNDTYIQLRTGTSVADLHYRNGTTVRNVNNGFYTE